MVDIIITKPNIPSLSRGGLGRGWGIRDNPSPLTGEGWGAAVQSRHNHTGVSTGTMAPDGEGARNEEENTSPLLRR